MNDTRILYGKRNKGGHTKDVPKSQVKSSTNHCCHCFLTIGHGEKRTKTVIGDVHDECLHKITTAAFKKAGLSSPRISTSPRATLEEAFSALFYNEKPDQAKMKLLNALHKDFFGSPVDVFGISTTREIARKIIDTPATLLPSLHVAFMATKFQEAFGQPIDVSRVRLLY